MLFAADIVQEAVIEWDDSAEAVRAVRRERLGALVLREGTLSDPDPERVTNALLEGIRRGGLGRLRGPRARRGLGSGSRSFVGSIKAGRT